MIVILVLFNTALYTGLSVWQNNEIVSAPDTPDKVVILAVNKGPGFDITPPVIDTVDRYYPVYVPATEVDSELVKNPPTANILHEIMITGGSYTEAYERAQRENR